MIRLDPARMRSLTEARQGLNQLVSDAKDGVTTHIVSGGRVVAHLVPVDAPIIDNPWRHADLFNPVIAQEADLAETATWHDGCLFDVGDALGQILGWAWHTDHDLFVSKLVLYVQMLSDRVGRPLGLDAVDLAVRRGLSVVLFRGEDQVALDYAREHWPSRKTSQ